MIIEYLYPAYDFIKKTQRELKSVKGLTNEESGGVFYYERSWRGFVITFKEFVVIENVRKEYDALLNADTYLPNGIDYRIAIRKGFEKGLCVGDWHTHFGNIVPSTIDDETMKDKSKHVKESAMIIISEIHSKLFLYKKDRIKTQIL